MSAGESECSNSSSTFSFSPETTRSLSLTSAGATLYKSGSAAFEQIEEAKAQILELQTEPRGSIRISVPNSYGQKYLTPLFSEFLLQNPGIDLHVEYSDRFVDVVEEGFDLVVRIGDLADSTLSAQKIGESSLHIAASPDYWRKHKRPTHPEKLRTHECIIYQRQRKPREWHLERHGQAIAVPVHGRLLTDSGEAMVESAIHGLGCGQPTRLPYPRGANIGSPCGGPQGLAATASRYLAGPTRKALRPPAGRSIDGTFGFAYSGQACFTVTASHSLHLCAAQVIADGQTCFSPGPA